MYMLLLISSSLFPLPTSPLLKYCFLVSRSKSKILKYTIPIELYNPSIKEVEENTERVRSRLTDVATNILYSLSLVYYSISSFISLRMSENYERAKQRRRIILDEAKEKAVREWLFTKRKFDLEKDYYDRLHQNWQAAYDRVAATTQDLDEARNEYETLRRFYGVEDPAPSHHSSANPSPTPSPRIRHATPSPNSNSPTWRERGSTDPVRPTLSSPPTRPVSINFGQSPIRPKIIRRSSDPPPKYRNQIGPQNTQQPTQQTTQQNAPQSAQQSTQTQQQSAQTAQLLQPVVEQEEPFPQQQQRKLQVHQQLLQTLQNQLLSQPKPSSPPLPTSQSLPSTPHPLPTPPQPASFPRQQTPIKFPFLQQQGDSPNSSPQPSPITTPQPSPQVSHRHAKSLPPIPNSPPARPIEESQQTQPHAHAQTQFQAQQIGSPPQLQSIQILQEQERKHTIAGLPRSHSDDQTKKAHDPQPPVPLSHSLPDLPSLTDVLQLAKPPQKTEKTVLSASLAESIACMSLFSFSSCEN